MANQEVARLDRPGQTLPSMKTLLFHRATRCLLFAALLVTAWHWSALAAAAQAPGQPPPTLEPTSVQVQGRLPFARSVDGPAAAPDERYVTTLTVEAFPDGGSPGRGRPRATPIAAAFGQTDRQGQFIVVLHGLVQGRYDLVLRPAHALSVIVPSIEAPAAPPRIVRLDRLPTPLEGDADGDDSVTILDFSLLAQAFGRQAGTASYDPRPDFNQDGRISIADFSLLLANWGRGGDAAVARPPPALVSRPPPALPIATAAGIPATPVPRPLLPVVTAADGQPWMLDDLAVLWAIALSVLFAWAVRRARAPQRHPALAPAGPAAPARQRGVGATSSAPASSWQRLLRYPVTVAIYASDFAAVEPLISRLEQPGTEIAVHLLDARTPPPTEEVARSDVVVLDSDLSATALTVYADLRESQPSADQRTSAPAMVILCPNEEIASLYGQDAAPQDHYVARSRVLAWAQATEHRDGRV